jgi:serine/threonine protein phosphatase PrpC
MGGHAGGKEASELAIRTILEVVEAAPPATTAGAALKRAIEEANARIWSMPIAEAGYRPGSTVVAVLLHEAGAEVAHVGDSRLYLVHAGAISQVTRDHSMVQELVDRNLIRAEDAAKHPDANKILRALGIAKEVEVDLRPSPLAYVTGDVLVLCSDGLSDLVEPGEILQIAGSHPPAQAAGQLVDLANARGGHDNITALVVRMKTTATTPESRDGGGRGVPKTMPLTAHMAAPDEGSGPTGTVVSAPVAGPSAGAPAPAPAIGAPPPSVRAIAPPQHPGTAPAPAIPRAPPSSSSPVRSRTPILVLGILLAVVAVVLVAAIVIITTRPHRRSVTLVVDEPRLEAGAPDNDNASPEPTVAPAPTLSTPPAGKHIWRRSDGGVWDPCASARRARERDASATVIDRLDEKCRASGGTVQ